MNRNKKIMLLCVLGMMVGTSMMAQHYSPEIKNSLKGEEALRLIDAGHYFAASQRLEQMGEEADEALKLLCDYHLTAPETTENLAEWLDSNRQHPLRSRLELLYANRLVAEGQYNDALNIYASNENITESMPNEEQDETNICRAIAYIGTDRIDEAETILMSMQDCKTHQMDMVYYTGYVRYVKGEYQNALTDFILVSKNSDYDSQMPIYMADCYLHTGEPQKALALLNNQLPLANKQLDNVNSLEASRIRGEAHYDTGNYTKAIEALSQYVYGVENPQRTATYKLGMANMSIQEYAKAAPLLSKSTGTATDEMAQSGWLNAGICYVYAQNSKQAQIAFQQASEMNANKEMQEEALFNYALSLHEGNTMGFGESVDVFERFLNQFPNSQYAPSVAKHLSEVYFTTKNYPAALASINKIKNPSKEILNAKQKVLYNLGIQEFIGGNYKQSNTYTAQAIQLGSKEAYYLKGESEYRQGQYANAVTDLKQFVNGVSSSNANYPQALYSLGYAYFKQKKYSEAKNYFSRVANTKVASTVKADALNRLADCMFTESQYDNAYATYERALQTDKSLGDYSLYQMAFINGLKGQYDQKVELLNQMGGQYADSQYGADALFEQGRAYLQSGAKQKAVETFVALINKYPHSQNARSAGNEVGAIYQEAGQLDEAMKAYTRVLNNYPNTREAQTALSRLKNIYAEQGKVNEYAELAQKAGKALSGNELDEMTSTAALNAENNADYAKAYQYYNQLSQQTTSSEVQMTAMEGKLRNAFAAKDYKETVNVASAMLSNARMSQTMRNEAQLFRAESYLALGKAAEGVKDLQLLCSDKQTIYGAQANVRLSQYAYDTSQYQAAEQLLLKFIDSGTTHQYWLARAFILLSDVYKKTDRDVEAKEYLMSLKSNYSENEEINKMINERLR